MVEYIKKSSLLSHYRVDKENIHVVDCDVIYGLAAEDVRPERHGHWIWDDNSCKCSVCGHSYNWHDNAFLHKANYCPNCGARMDDE